MITQPRLLFEQDPAQGEKLYDILEQTTAQLFSATDSSKHTDTIGDWTVTLTTGEDGGLTESAATRCGSETYKFARIGDKTWAAVGEFHSFEDTHFYNLVSMVVRHAETK